MLFTMHRHRRCYKSGQTCLASSSAGAGGALPQQGGALPPMEGGADGAAATVHMVALQEADTGEST